MAVEGPASLRRARSCEHRLERRASRTERRQAMTHGTYRPAGRRIRHGAACGGVALAAALLACAPPSQARVTKIVVDTKVSPAFGGAQYPAGSGRAYETLAGRVWGELDPN